jgi:hypothetical protein
MKALTKIDMKQLASIVSVLIDTREKLEADEANYRQSKTAVLLNILNKSAEAYSLAVEGANEFRQDIAAVIEDYIEAYAAWKEAWEEEFTTYVPATKPPNTPTAGDWEDFDINNEDNIAELLEELPTSPDI